MLTPGELLHFRKNLLAWFVQFQRHLPWRRTKDPYRVWISEIMLQQTRVAAAIPYYERFLERFPDVKTLAEAPDEDVLRLWSGLGYYSRARNLQKAAREIAFKHSGIFPPVEKEALDLPGIGKYTAAAILSIAYGKKLAVVDGNVARVIARLNAVRGDLHAANRWQQLQESADAMLAPEAPGDWNQAMMELGATLCTPRAPQCLICPVNKFCQARKLGLAKTIPEKRKERSTVELTLASLVLVDRQGHTLLLAPPRISSKSAHTSDVAALVSRLWHFPTLAVQKNATRELRQYFEQMIIPGRKLAAKLTPLEKVRHAVTYRSITLLPFRAMVRKLPRVTTAKSLPLSDFSSVPISSLTRKVARMALFKSN